MHYSFALGFTSFFFEKKYHIKLTILINLFKQLIFFLMITTNHNLFLIKLCPHNLYKVESHLTKQLKLLFQKKKQEKTPKLRK